MHGVVQTDTVTGKQVKANSQVGWEQQLLPTLACQAVVLLVDGEHS